MAGSTIRWACCGRCLSRWRSTCYSHWPAWRCAGAGRWPRWRLGSSSRGRCTAWPARARPGRICMAMRPASTPSPWAAALRRAGAARPVRRPGRPAVRAIIGAAMAGLYLAWPIGQSNVLGTTAMAFGTALLLLGGPRRQGACPALARAGRLWSAQLRDLPVPSGGAGPDPGLGAAGAGVGRRAGRVAGGLSGGVLRGRLAGGAVVVGAANAALRLHTRA